VIKTLTEFLIPITINIIRIIGAKITFDIIPIAIKKPSAVGMRFDWEFANLGFRIIVRQMMHDISTKNSGIASKI